MNIDIKRVKIFVTIPLDSVGKVREAVCNAGAGIIGEYTFSHTNISTITIPEGVTSIGDNCFNECRSLTNVELP